MKSEAMVVVRIYLSESEHRAMALLEWLRDRRIAGATLLRGVAGYAGAGSIHRSDLLDLSADLPLIVEFVDKQDVVDTLLPELLARTRPHHLLRWPVESLSA